MRTPAPLRVTLAVGLSLSVSLAFAQPRFVIDTAVDHGAVSRDLYGANLEYTARNVPATADFAAQFTMLRIPGGDARQQFDWRTADPGPCNARWNWEAYATLAARANQGLFLETNIVRGTPEGAAAWVMDARRRGLRVGVVAIGNEVWGDFDDGFRPAARYAADLRAHATAIHRVAPDVPIAAAIGTFNEDAWNREVIRRAGDVIDALDIHWYPHHREYERAPPSEIMAEPEAIPQLMARLRGIVRDEAPARASHIRVILGEYDCAEDPPANPAEVVPGRAYSQWAMPNAVCWGSALGEMIREGIPMAFLYTVQGYRFGAIPGNECDMNPPSLVRPKVLAHRLYREHFGDRLVEVTAQDVPSYRSEGPPFWDGFQGEAPYLKAYASLADGGRSLRVIVVSRRESGVDDVAFALRDFDPLPDGRLWELVGDNVRASNENVNGPRDAVRIEQRALTVTGRDFTYRVPPHSVTAIELTRRGAGPTDGGFVADGGLVADGGALADGSTGAPPADGGDGCQCHTGPSPTDARGGWWSVVLLAAAWTHHARRRAKRGVEDATSRTVSGGLQADVPRGHSI
jgi:MYXO-CTERM domain-containing protein